MRERILALIQKEVVPAIGCTEPMAVALCTARATEKLGRRPERIEVRLSANILKNAMGVGIPGTGMIGLPIAVALGALIGKSAYQLEVLKDLTPEAVAEGKQYVGEERIDIQLKKNIQEKLYIEVTCKAGSEKATAIIEHITYDVLDDSYSTDLFTDSTIKGRLGANAMKANKHLYDHIVYDSTNERDFAADLDTNENVAVYVKLPDGFYISTPVGHYNPDWAIAFYEGKVKHIYFVAETKGSMNSMQLRLIEESKIHCAREHFKAISNGNIVYDVVDSYKSLLEKVMK